MSSKLKAENHLNQSLMWGKITQSFEQCCGESGLLWVYFWYLPKRYFHCRTCFFLNNCKGGLLVRTRSLNEFNWLSIRILLKKPNKPNVKFSSKKNKISQLCCHLGNNLVFLELLCNYLARILNRKHDVKL